MGIRPRRLALAVLLLACSSFVHADDEQAARDARWSDLRHAFFGDRPVQDGSAWIDLRAPQRALDAALVPIGITLRNAKPVKGLYLIIDENPGPLAAHFSFGPLADPHMLDLRVRVNAYTNVHAVAETQDGALFAVAQFVKAAGGCSAPAGADAQQSMQELGHIKLKELQPFTAGRPLQVQVLIRHPNFNGMQMDQITRLYTPAMYIRTVDVNYGGAPVLHLDADISLSADPAITFGLVPPGPGKLQVLVRDTKDQTFGQSFDVPTPPG